MKLRDWHARETRRNPEYAAAAAEVEFVQSIADKLVAARIAAQMTQGELAQLAGTTQARISEMESGDGNPTAETIAKVFAALGLSASVSVISVAELEGVTFEVPSTSTEDVHQMATAACGTTNIVGFSHRTISRQYSSWARHSTGYTGIHKIVQRRGRVLA
ncbi:MAG TPA: helix-turn-helix transcriptional regulator [Gemmatimonadales bacterium]|nr:helix-turn-helix transcriptional regulator [Gemmatimonadales bacterium]